MAAGLALGRVAVTFTGNQGIGSAEWPEASVLVRNNRLALVPRDGGARRDEEGVSAVERISSRSWRITTPAGVYEVVRAKGCGCGS